MGAYWEAFFGWGAFEIQAQSFLERVYACGLGAITVSTQHVGATFAVGALSLGRIRGWACSPLFQGQTHFTTSLQTFGPADSKIGLSLASALRSTAAVALGNLGR